MWLDLIELEEKSSFVCLAFAQISQEIMKDTVEQRIEEIFFILDIGICPNLMFHRLTTKEIELKQN